MILFDRIIYGFPVMDDRLQKDMDKQRVYLAGCEKMIPPATRHCFHCDKDVCYTFLLVEEAKTTSFEFEMGGVMKDIERRSICCFLFRFYRKLRM